MRGLQWAVAALLAALAASGCNGPSKRTLAASEPGLSTLPADGEVAIADRTKPVPPRPITFADRHPLFSKPRQYYENTTSTNKAAKTAAGVVLGVPAGIYGELKQIVVGVPSTPASP